MVLTFSLLSIPIPIPIPITSSPQMLPPHLGGHSESYGEAVEETAQKLGANIIYFDDPLIISF